MRTDRDSTPPTTTDPVMTIADGAVTLGGRPVLRRVDLSVRPGEWVAVMGANGSGKSTLVRTLLGLWPLTTGQVTLFGTPVEDFHGWERIGFVPQRTGGWSGVPASVWEVVAAGRLTHRRLFHRLGKDDRRAIDDAIETVGLVDKTHEGIGTLSGGQQQRAYIARALAGEPEVLVLDEPTAGVDLPNQQALADTLEVLHERGATVLLVAHELGPMAPLIDRAVVMRDGRVAYDGPPLTAESVFDGDPFHHHHTPSGPHPHAPRISSPLDRDVHRREQEAP